MSADWVWNRNNDTASEWLAWDRMKRAAWFLLEEFGDPCPGGWPATSQNDFLFLGERAFGEALKEYRDALPEAPTVVAPARGGFWLYRLWGEGGRLLYVGVTRNAKARLAAHKRTWGDLIVDTTWEECEDAAAMLKAEAHAIATEYPALNVDHPDRGQ